MDARPDGSERERWFSPRRVPRGRIVPWSAWFGLGAGALFALVALRYLAVAPLASSWSARGFTALMFASQSVLFGLALAGPLALLAFFVPRPRVVAIAGIALGGAVLAVALVDTFVYQQYRFHLDAGVWNLLTGGAAAETFVFPARSYAELAGMVLGLCVALALVAALAWRWSNDAGLRPVRGFVAAGLALAVLAHGALCIWATAAAYVPITRQSRVLPLYVQWSARGWLRRLGIDVPRSEVPRDGAPPGLVYPRAPLASDPPAERPNVLFLVVDSWRADALDERTTPRLAGLARESVRFEEHSSCGNATRIGLFTLFYGIPGTYWHDVLAERRGCALVGAFLRAGYEVQAFRSAPLTSPEFDCTIFEGVPDLRLVSEGERPWQRDLDATHDFVDWIEHRDASRPFFALVFWDAPHAYDLPPDAPRPFEPCLEVVDYLALGPGTDPRPFRNRYLNAVHFVDGLAGRALDALRSSGEFERTLVLVTGDHGQEFDDLGRNYWGHNSNFGPPQVHVPFFVRWPGRAPRSYLHATSHFDVAPTLLAEVLGCTNPLEDVSVGRSLFDPAPRGVLTMATYSDFAAVRPGERYVVVRGSGELEVFDAQYAPSELTDEDRAALRETMRQRTWFRPVER